jgi:hypothetical protein
VKETLKSGHFWVGVITGVLLLAFFPQVNPRVMLSARKA